MDLTKEGTDFTISLFTFPKWKLYFDYKAWGLKLQGNLLEAEPTILITTNKLALWFSFPLHMFFPRLCRFVPWNNFLMRQLSAMPLSPEQISSCVKKYLNMIFRFSAALEGLSNFAVYILQFELNFHNTSQGPWEDVWSHSHVTMIIYNADIITFYMV